LGRSWTAWMISVLSIPRRYHGLTGGVHPRQALRTSRPITDALLPDSWAEGRVPRSRGRTLVAGRCLDAIVPSGASVRNQPTRDARPQASRSSRAGALGSALADPRSVSNDPKVARPRLKTIDCQRDGVSGRSGRPTVAHTMDLAVSLEVTQPSERLVFVQACDSRDHRSRERAGHLPQCRSQAIPTRLGLALPSLGLRRQDSGGIGRSGLGCRLTPYRRVVTEASSATAAQDHRLTSGRADDLKPTPSAPGATDAAATPGAFHLDQVRIVHWLWTVIIGSRSGTDGGSRSFGGFRLAPLAPSVRASSARLSDITHH
jgi:hypothetical protein